MKSTLIKSKASLPKKSLFLILVGVLPYIMVTWLVKDFSPRLNKFKMGLYFLFQDNV